MTYCDKNRRKRKLKNNTMTKEAAIEAMRQGHKVVHRLFSKSEYLSCVVGEGREYYIHSFGESRFYPVPSDFWANRQSIDWENNWRIVE